MKNLNASFRKLQVLQTAINLFKQYGFNKVGVDRIIAESQLTKATFYNYFHSKERLIEMCLMHQKDMLMEQMRKVIETSQYSPLTHQLRQIYLIHADLNSAYYLLFKAIFEIKMLYPHAYQSAIRYRRWLKNETFCLMVETKKTASYAEAEIFGFMIDSAILELLSSHQNEEPKALLEYFLTRFIVV
ncbi:TetR/AcrR family transcriptional regulator [Acinetobacter sp.]|jgi:AcrR family transcriptional regulator|uniref:TetR/AcrR family transcriptional regulator n=1 Tax=Acinetobacter sp. TaxID=472 RepID=UPI0028378542|nr:TetR/AcrR family transcriptional regulator [Acinetobacter sp.]MDR2250168.1 TetR/AcrR family transcriptional regulator [Acinetobacter sp.]